MGGRLRLKEVANHQGLLHLLMITAADITDRGPQEAGQTARHITRKVAQVVVDPGPQVEGLVIETVTDRAALVAIGLDLQPGMVGH